MLSVTAVPLSYFAAATALAAAFDAPAEVAQAWAEAIACLAEAVGLGCLGFGVYWSCVDLPSHSHADAADTQAGAAAAAGFQGKSPRAISHGIVWPIWAWALLAPLAMAPLVDPPEARGEARAAVIGWKASMACTAPVPCAPVHGGRLPINVVLASPASWLPMGSVLVLLSAFELAWWTVTRPKSYQRGTLTTEQKADARRKHSEAFRKNGPGWLVSVLVSAGLLWLGIDLAHGHSALWLVCLGPSGSWSPSCSAPPSTSRCASRGCQWRL